MAIKMSQTSDLHEVYNSANWHTRHVKFDSISQKYSHKDWLEDCMTADVMIMNWRTWAPNQLEIRFSSLEDATFWDLSWSIT